MSERKHRPTAEWKELIEEQRASGMTGVAFCNERGLSAKTFYKQRKRLGYVRGKASPGPGGFIQIQPGIRPSISAQPVVLHYGESRLELAADMSPAWVAELLRALS